MSPVERILSTPLPAGGTARQGVNVELGDVVKVTRATRLRSDFPPRWPFRGNGQRGGRGPLRGAVIACSRSRTPSPRKTGVKKGPRRLNITASRLTSSEPTLLWDGEMGVTYVTFRRYMGAAFMVALLGIYLLVVAQFGSFKLPLVILAPVPLTLIGIMLGHLLFNAAFTATSMIGFIALAGIVVRNSILLVDFIRHLREKGLSLRAALIEAGSVRFKPNFLTAAAAMIAPPSSSPIRSFKDWRSHSCLASPPPRR